MEDPEDIDPFDPTDFVNIGDQATHEVTQIRYELGAGAMVGDYRIEGKIGEGGMGVVFSASHPLIGKRAAVKVLQRELCTDRTALARFVDEARVVNKIGHPNIVDIFALGQLPDGRSYLIMEWLQGETLRARLARTRIASLDLPEIIHVLRSLCRALDAAHDKSVVHRDLKPDNVFLVAVRGDRPLIKLLDFGIAKLVHAEHRIDRTASNQIIGTPLYIAPEQARAEPVDQRADIYALGAIAFEMLTGRPPFDGKTAMEVVAKHMYEPPVRASSIAGGLPPELDDCVFAMMSKDPGSRPTLADLATILDHLEQLGRTMTPILRGNMPISERVSPTIGPSATVATASALPSGMPVRHTPAITPMSPAHTAMAPPMSAMTPMSMTPMPMTSMPMVSRRRWVLPAVIGSIAAVGVIIAVVATRGGGSIEATSQTTRPTQGTEPATPTETAGTSDPKARAADPSNAAAADPKAETKTATDPKTEIKTEAGREPKGDTKTEVASDPKTKTATDAATDPKTKTATDAATDPKTKTATDPKTEPATDPKVDPKSDVATDPKFDPRTVKTDPKSKTATATDPKIDPKTAAATDPKSKTAAVPPKKRKTTTTTTKKADDDEILQPGSIPRDKK